MKTNIHAIKRLVDELEKMENDGSKVEAERLLDKIIAICGKIKEEMREAKNLSEKIQIENINKIPFLYKPILKKNYYEGTYLEEFAQRRTFELKDTKTLDIHNKFWHNHEILRGNIFGSLPKGLISKEKIIKLERYGWEEVVVNILEIKNRSCSIKELVEYCELKYHYFLVVNEKSTGAELILHYEV